MGKIKKNKIGADTKIVDYQNSTVENDLKSTLITDCIEGITTNISKSEVLGKQSGKNKSKNKGDVIPEDEKYDPKELDDFCDDLDEEANSTFNHWVSLLEAQFSGKNRNNSKLPAIKPSEDIGMASGTKQMKSNKESSTTDKKSCGAGNPVESQISKISRKKNNIDKKIVELEVDKTSTLVESKNKQKKSKKIQAIKNLETRK